MEVDGASLGSVKDYVNQLIVVMLGIPEDEARALLDSEATQSQMLNFIMDAALPVLFVYLSFEETEDEDIDEGRHTLSLGLSVSFTERCRGFALLKNEPVSFMDNLQTKHIPPCRLLQLVQLSSFFPPYNMLHSVIVNAFEPYFTKYVTERGGFQGRKKSAVTQINGHFDGLKVALYQCQETLHVPEIDIDAFIHPEIRKMMAGDGPRGEISAALIDEMEQMSFALLAEISKILDQVKHKPEIPNTTAELNYWGDLSDAFKVLQDKIDSESVQTTLQLLRENHRSAFNLRSKDIFGLLDLEKKVAQSYCDEFIKDFPIVELKHCGDLVELAQIVEVVFAHLRRMKNCAYPPDRAQQLVKAVSRDIIEQIIKILDEHRILKLDYAHFDRIANRVLELFHSLKQSKDSVRNALKSSTRKSSAPQFSSGSYFRGRSKDDFRDERSERLERRIDELRKFRREHHELTLVVKKVFDLNQRSPGAVNPNEQIKTAYRILVDLGSSLLDISSQGEQTFRAAMTAYEESLDEVEKVIIQTIRDQLGSARNSAESFRVFSKFNALFYKDAIRNSVDAYRKQLENQVSEDLGRLEETFVAGYPASPVFHLGDSRDIPEVSGQIIWAKQIEKQLDTYVARVEAIFGKGWERLLHLRKEVSWVLNESLAEVFKVPLPKLLKNCRRTKAFKNVRKPEIIGTALVIKYLEIVYPESRPEWEEVVEEARIQLLSDEKADEGIRPHEALAAANTLWVEHLHASRRHQKDLIDNCNRIRKKIHDNIRQVLARWNAAVLADLKGGKWGILRIGPTPEASEAVIIDGKIFDVFEREKGTCDLRVNFHPAIIAMLREYRVLSLPWLKLREHIRKQIMKAVVNAMDIYPHYLSLTASINAYKRMVAKIGEGVVDLAAQNMHIVHTVIGKGFQASWKKTYSLKKFSSSLAESVTDFESKTTTMLERTARIEKEVELLGTCHFNDLAAHLKEIQSTIDAMNLNEEQYSNLSFWVEKLNTRIETILTERLATLLQVWKKRFNDLSLDEDDVVVDKIEKEPFFQERTLTPQTILIKLVNKSMRASPSLQKTRMYWYGRLNDYLAVVLNLPKLRSSRYDQTLTVSSRDMTYSYLLTTVPHELVRDAYVMIQKKMGEVKAYISQWLQYEVLYNIDSFTIAAQLKSQLGSWMSLLTDIRTARQEAESSEAEHRFGPVIVDFREIQSKIHLRYDKTLKDMLTKFRDRLGKKGKDFYANLVDERAKLEAMDVSSQDGGLEFLSRQAEITNTAKEWGHLLERVESGEHILEQNHMRLKAGWIYAQRIRGEWEAFNAILVSREEAMRTMKSVLVRKCFDHHKHLQELVAELVADWRAKKPIENQDPGTAINRLQSFEIRITSIRDEQSKMELANKVLQLELEGTRQLDPIEEEINNLKSVWQSLKKYYDGLATIRASLLNAILPTDVKRQLESFLDEIKKTSQWMQSYEPVLKFKEMVLDLRKTIPVLADLRTEAMESKHWNELNKKLHTTFNSVDVKVGQLWEADINLHWEIFEEIITIAKGELVLRVYLRETKQTWSEYSFTLVDFNGRCSLIKGWDDFFETINDTLKGLSSTRASPYFKPFREECIAWENKLSSINFICDIWMDVQRIWVYLEGVFIGNSDIKAQLPAETSRFAQVDKEFIRLMRKVKKNPLVMEVLEIPNVQRQLERLHEMLLKIQKSLGEYLEKQRQAFPRFYFVGDEDLLEIIGHTGDPFKVQRHLKKMFAGINSLMMKDEGEKRFTVSGMMSGEGEEVAFANIVEITPARKIHEWLSDVEASMRVSLADILIGAVDGLMALYSVGNLTGDVFNEFLDAHPVQLILLASQIVWTKCVETAIEERSLDTLLGNIIKMLQSLAGMVLEIDVVLRRTKVEQLITEMVHQRTAVRDLVTHNVTNPEDFTWLVQMRFHLRRSSPWNERVLLKIANAQFFYGFEYLGITDKLVQTPLTDRCYLALTQALFSRQGGSPFGPAGTGKTETVKMLGAQLGRYCIVFNCDENFDFQAMGRIFVGLCQCGAWGCFDEFNRLNEKILSAVSQQILTIQRALRDDVPQIELIGRQVHVTTSTGIFITMNPGYAGRSQLPQNLKQLFRSIAMVKPDKEIIAEVIMLSQGFVNSELLARKVVLFFHLCQDELSNQSHYDFGLRALKSVLVNAGHLKRETLDHSAIAEQKILIQSVLETVTPKLVGDDKVILRNLLVDLFPGADLGMRELGGLLEKIHRIAEERQLVPEESWVEKVIQLYQIQNLSHGVILVGPAGIGKSTCWQVLVKAIEEEDKEAGRDWAGVSYVIDPKALTKEELYGVLDSTTREWTDGIFTHILRKIVDDVRGESEQRHWIVFDGDVDPEWVENLNSVLDCNKLFTLPNGERLAVPSNVRILFEVRNLDYATLATVSRCGMVWYGEEVLSSHMIVENYLRKLKVEPVDKDLLTGGEDYVELQTRLERILRKHMREENGILEKALRFAESAEHVMSHAFPKALASVFSLLNEGILDLYEYQIANTVVFEDHFLDKYITKRLLFSTFWGVGSAMLRQSRTDFSEFLKRESLIPVPDDNFLESVPGVDTGEWGTWSQRVPTIEVDARSIITGAVIPTSDTARHSELLISWIKDRRCVVLCGPPGSGKTMILTSVLKALHNFIAVPLNFSSATSPELILRTFEQHCRVVNRPEGLVLRPAAEDKKLVLFCDEINLPANDTYGTQRVITFIRQIVEHQGYYRPSDKAWIKVEKVYFVGACNPPTDPGRVVMTPRFLRHTGILYVDFPGRPSLMQIYRTFTVALLNMDVSKHLKHLIEPATLAMVEFYSRSQQRFTKDMQPHYIYSPRELTRWLRALHKGIMLGPPQMDDQAFIRLLAHEGLRIFVDRLVLREEKDWTMDQLDEVVSGIFPDVQHDTLARPILYTFIYEDGRYISMPRDTLGDFVQDKMDSFVEEQLDVRLVLFDDVLEHVLRIDRVLRQPLGHLLLAGASGAGKTVLPKFVAWMIGFEVFQIKAHSKYTLECFEEDLRKILTRAGVDGKSICFIFDESNILEPAFLEYMNALLASGEVPGLFEEDAYTTLMAGIKNAINTAEQKTEEEYYQWFIERVQEKLHIVFTINPVGVDFKNRQCTSPALFNRCVVDWFGDWSDNALRCVGRAFMEDVSLGSMPAPASVAAQDDATIREAKHDILVECLVSIHHSVREVCEKLNKSGHALYVTPRHYLDLISHFTALYDFKVKELTDSQNHIDRGLQNLRSTEEEVARLKVQLEQKNIVLRRKNKEARDKLDVIVADKSTSERLKQDALQTQAMLEEKNVEIAEREGLAQQNLETVLPMLEDAKSRIKNVPADSFKEMQALRHPPLIVKRVLAAVCSLLDGRMYSHGDWNSTMARIRKGGFLGFRDSIINFPSESVAASHVSRVRKIMGGVRLDAADRGSRALGPLARWALSQLVYAEAARKIAPLRAEVSQIRKQKEEIQVRVDAEAAKIKELEERIRTYEEDYRQLLAETGAIRVEMEQVEAKVNRSTALLSSLSSETSRWGTQSVEFRKQLESVAADVLMSCAFLTYIGSFDEHMRRVIFRNWAADLAGLGLHSKPDLQVIGYLSDADQRMAWEAAGLPVDELFVENAIMLHRFNRYPLIIDPTGAAVEFLMNAYADKRIVKTSFLDPGFLKNLETSLRFGSPLLVEDAENIDPILNPVLNREIIRRGGRNLVRIASADVDFSANFRLFMSTRDPTFHFTVDLMSRVTMVNFTVTPASLQSQCLNIVLHSERPDIERKRSEHLKLQGEYARTLRGLEDKLLKNITEASNILEDESVLKTLENCKESAREIAEKAEQSQRDMVSCEEVRSRFAPLARYCSKLFFSLEGLDGVHFLYHFSLEFFLKILHAVLEVPGMEVPDLASKLFHLVYNRVSKSLLHDDRITFAMKLAEIRLSATDDDLPADEYAVLLTGGKIFPRKIRIPAELGLPESQVEALTELSKVTAFNDLEIRMSQQVSQWQRFLNAPGLVDCPCVWDPSTSPIIEKFRRLLIVKILRPELLLGAASDWLDMVFGPECRKVQVNLEEIVFKEIDSHTPLLLVSLPGFDASDEVQELTWRVKKQLKTVAMGSAEGYEAADAHLPKAMKFGTWIHLKNVHLAPSYLMTVEKSIHEKKLKHQLHDDFRLFLTAELNKSIPVNLLRRSYKLVYEPAPGLKASLTQSFSSLDGRVVDRDPVQRSKLYLLATWFHVVVQERLRFVPLGWSKYYEFTQGDLKWALDAVDKWVDICAGSKSNVLPTQLPWKALHTLIGQSIYGGKIANPYDTEILQSFLRKFFSPEAYEASFRFFDDPEEPIITPQGLRFEDYTAWVEALPSTERPEWMGLPSNVKILTQRKAATVAIGKLMKLRDTRGSTDLMGGEAALEQVASVWGPARAVAMTWKSVLPEDILALKLDSISSDSHLFRCFSRDIKTAAKLLLRIHKDIDELLLVADSKIRPNRHHWDMLDCIGRGQVPKDWKMFAYLSTISLNEYVSDFSKRVAQLNLILSKLMRKDYCQDGVSLGRLLSPEAYISSTRQEVAHDRQVALETLSLEVVVGETTVRDDCSFVMHDLVVTCAKWENGRLRMDEKLFNEFPPVLFRWVVHPEEEEAGEDDHHRPKGKLAIPLYLNRSRSHLLCSLTVPSDIDPDTCYLRGICFLAWHTM